MSLPDSLKNLNIGAKLNTVVISTFVTLLIITTIVVTSSVEGLTIQTGRRRAEQETEIVQRRFEESKQDLLAATKIIASTRGLIEVMLEGDATTLKTIILVSAAPLDIYDWDIADVTGTRSIDLDEEAGQEEDQLLTLALVGIETTGVIFEEEDSTLRVAAAIPLRDASGAIVGGMVASRLVDDEFLAEINFYREDVHLALITDGQILAQGSLKPEHIEDLSAGLLAETATGQALSGQVVAANDLLYSKDNVPHALAYAPVTVQGETQAAIGILVELSELYDFQRRLVSEAGLTIIVIALAALILLSLFNRRNIAIPLSKFRSVAERMANGDYQQRAEVTTRDEIGQLASVFNTLAARLERTLAGLEKRAAQLALINDVGEKVTAVLELDSLLDMAACMVQERFGHDHVGLFIVDRERGELVMRAKAGAFRDLFPPGHRLKLDQGMVGWAGRHGETLLANDVEAEPRYTNLYPGVMPTRSELSVPVLVGQEIVGVLDVQNSQLNAFDENDRVVMETLADQIAVAIENARLYETVQQELAERKRAEAQLQRYAADLERANADVVRASEDIARASEEVKQFAYIVSHDLRAPLVNLKGFAAELRAALAVLGSTVTTILPHLDERQQEVATLALQEDIPEALEFIESSVDRMDHFITAVLKLSRLGRRELKPEPVDVDAIVQATLTSLTHQLEEHHAEVTVGPLPQVVADRTAMEQIVGNLLGNAVKYLDPDRPGELEITAERSHDEVRFQIRDNGRGIAAEDMDKVFAPFRRAGRQDVPGEGMGLPYVQTLVRRHGGRIWCESELGVGTTFTFTISDHPAEGDNHA
jgi:signal transduction histidine kinase/HAMP domain-containing protein